MTLEKIFNDFIRISPALHAYLFTPVMELR